MRRKSQISLDSNNSGHVGYNANLPILDLGAQECINDMWDAGCRDDKLSILHKENQTAQCVIKNPSGKSKPVTMNNLIMQGGVMGSIYCTNTMDKLGKMMYDDKKLLYTYKGTEVPCLQKVDDILTITKCDATAITMNTVVNTFIETKKLKLTHKKCSVIHVGKKCIYCPKLKVHGEEMNKADRLTYLGDIVHESGKKKYNLLERRAKTLGKNRIQTGLQLRQAMFANGVL